MQDSVFTRIIKGEIPCHKVYEDDRTIAFMDIHPVQPGMVLVVPKTQVGNFYELGHEDSHALWQTVTQVAKKLKSEFPDCARIAVQIEGLDVDHAHVKLFPFTTAEQYRSLPDPTDEPEHTALAELAQKLAF